MAKATTIKEAIKRFEDVKTVTAAEQAKVLAANLAYRALSQRNSKSDVDWQPTNELAGGTDGTMSTHREDGCDFVHS